MNINLDVFKNRLKELGLIHLASLLFSPRVNYEVISNLHPNIVFFRYLSNIVFKKKSDCSFKEYFSNISESLKVEDIPKQFSIFFVARNDWYGVVADILREHQSPLRIETPYQRFPLELQLWPLSRNHYYHLESKMVETYNQENSIQKSCFESEKIKEIRNLKNCTGFCIPFVYKVFMNKSAEIKVCEKFNDHFCAMPELFSYINKQQLTCMKPMIEKNFIGSVKFQDDFTNYNPHIINGEKKKRTLMQLYWWYQSNITMISEERLVYDTKDLLAWMGGALGIFIGYSFFDLSKHIIDFAFRFIYQIVN